MARYTFSKSILGRTWEINVDTSDATNDPLHVKQWPQIKFIGRPEEKLPGIYSRELNIPFFDIPDSGGKNLTERLISNEYDVEVNLNGSLDFVGTTYVENTSHEIQQDNYDAQFMISDGMKNLKEKFGTLFPLDANNRPEHLTIAEFLRKVMDETGHVLPIELYTDWDEDNSDVGQLIPEKHRIRGLRNEDDSWWDVLDKFCTTFGYQCFQWGGNWVLRQLSVFVAGSVTKYTISTGGVVSSASVNISDSLASGYEESREDILQGIGSARALFKLPAAKKSFKNTSFTAFDGSNFDGWLMSGVVTQFEDSGNPFDGDNTWFTEFDDIGDELRQENNTVLQFGDKIGINAGVRIVNLVADSDSRLPDTTTVRWLQIKFTDGNDGSVYYLKEDGTVTTTVSYISDNLLLESDPSAPDEFDLTFNLKLYIDDNIGFPVGFAGKMTLIAVSEMVQTGTNNFLLGTDILVRHAFINGNITLNNLSYARVVSTATAGSLSGRRNITTAITGNNSQYASSDVEYYDGANWLPAQNWGGDDFGEKRVRDEIKFNDRNMRSLDIEHDWGTINDINKVYTFEGNEFIPLTLDYFIGQADINAYLVQHEATGNVISVSQTFDFGPDADESDDDTSSGGGSTGSTTDSDNQTLAEVLTEGNVANQDIDMAGHGLADIDNIDGGGAAIAVNDDLNLGGTSGIDDLSDMDFGGQQVSEISTTIDGTSTNNQLVTALAVNNRITNWGLEDARGVGNTFAGNVSMGGNNLIGIGSLLASGGILSLESGIDIRSSLASEHWFTPDNGSQIRFGPPAGGDTHSVYWYRLAATAQSPNGYAFEAVLNGGEIMAITGGSFQLNAGTSVNEIVTTIDGTSTDDQLPTAAAVNTAITAAEQTLSEVLTAGNDAGGKTIDNVGKLYVGITDATTTRQNEIRANVSGYTLVIRNQNSTNGNGLLVLANNSSSSPILNCSNANQDPNLEVQADGNILMFNLPSTNPGPGGYIWYDPNDSNRLKMGS